MCYPPPGLLGFGSEMGNPASQGLQIRTLGPFEVNVDGRAVSDDAWPRRKTRDLLKILLTSPGDMFTVDQLVDALLPDADVSRAGSNIRARVSELRGVLEPELQRGSESRFIKRIGDGYAFITSPDSWLDTVSFEQGVATGHRHADENRWPEAAEAFETAVALYRGEFLAEDRYAEWAGNARSRLRNLHIGALTRLAACYAELGRLRQAISCCQQVLIIEPYREEVIQHLIEYQHAAGHRAQALETFQEGAKALQEHLHVEPSPEILALRDRIRHEDAPTARLDPRRIAVLPFQNYSPDPDDEYLADGMTEELIGSLAKVRDFRVIARTSVVRFKDTEQPVSQIARSLSVGSIVEGSVRKDGDRVRISAQLIDARTEEHLWADEYEGNLRDTFAIQKNTAREVAEALQIRLMPAEQAVLQLQSIENVAAHTLFLKGRFFMAQRHPAASRKGLEYLERAVELDPSHARAHAALADAYTITSENEFSVEEAYRRAKAAVTRALEIDSDLAEAHTALGLIRFAFERDTLAARQSLARALEINPSYAVAYDWQGYIHGRLGQYTQAVASYRAAVAQDPLSPYHLFLLGRVLTKLNRFDEALSALDRALEIHPKHSGSLGRKVWCYHLLHDWEQAHAWLQTLKHHHAGLPNVSRIEGAHYLYLGQMDRSRASLERACDQSTPGSSFSHNFMDQLAEHFICARDFDASIMLLERILTENPDGQGAVGIAEPLFHLGIAYEQLNRPDEALASLRRAYEFLFASKIGQEPWVPSSEIEMSVWIPTAIGMVHAAMGDAEKAHDALDGSRTCPKNRGGQSARAVLCFRMGLLDEGFEALDLAVENHDWFILTIKTHPWFDPVRDDPRFEAVLQRMNLTS